MQMRAISLAWRMPRNTEKQSYFQTTMKFDNKTGNQTIQAKMIQKGIIIETLTMIHESEAISFSSWTHEG